MAADVLLVSVVVKSMPRPSEPLLDPLGEFWERLDRMRKFHHVVSRRQQNCRLAQKGLGVRSGHSHMP